MELENCDYVESFLENVQLDAPLGSFYLAQQVVRLLQKLIDENTFESEIQLKESIEKVSIRLSSAYPNEPSFMSIAAKFLRVFEEECRKSAEKGIDASDLDQYAFRKIAEGVIGDLVKEVDNSRESIAARWASYIRLNDVILTYGDSRTVEVFLKRARKSGEFKVWVMGELRKDEVDMVTRLREHEIEAYAAKETALYFLMPSITKVVVGAREATSNSGLVCLAGTYNVALAAQFYGKPVVACVPGFKFSSRQLCNAELLGNMYRSPGDIIPCEERAKFSKVKVQNSIYEFIPNELVERIISN